MSKTSVCYKTHILNKVIIDFIKKIYRDCEDSNSQMLNNFKGEYDIDFYLLIPDYLEKDLPETFKKFTKIYKEDEVKNIYKGFYSMWESNHFIDLYFYKNFGEKYNYIWFIEYDVRILGDSSYFWRNELNHDLLIPKNITFADSNWKYYNYLHESFSDKYLCFKQLYRSSKTFLMKLDELFQEGINGHCELIIGSVCKKYNFTYDYNFLNKRIQGLWTHNPEYSGYNIETFNKLAHTNIILPYIFHPIKIMKTDEKQKEINLRGKYERPIIEKIIQDNKLDKNIIKENKPMKKILIKKKI